MVSCRSQGEDQTYTPTADALQFRVSAHPEGLRSADHFDTYWGRVSDLPDFTEAHPMQCHYPASPPSVGDYLTVTDSSPQPGVGAANYVPAVSDGTQRRYGRKLINGVMSGRDPARCRGVREGEDRNAVLALFAGSG